MSAGDGNRTAARSEFFDRQAAGWSSTHYGTGGGMVARIARFADAVAGVATEGARIFDYGCGTGDIAAALARRGYDVEACDASPKMIEQAGRIHAGSGARFSVAISTGPDVALPSGEHGFDAIICSSVLEYVHDAGGSVRVLVSALRPGGWLLATVPNIAHPIRRREERNRHLLQMPLVRALARLTPRAASFEVQWLSHNRFPVEEWSGMFAAAGLSPVWQDCKSEPLALLLGQKR